MEKKANWEEFKNVLDQNHITKLYHFTDLDNLESIIKNGGLYSWADCEEKGITIAKPGGGDLSRSLDKRDGLQHYVRVSFAHDHPMMYVAMNDDRISNPVVLEIDIEAAFWKDSLYADRNATRNGANVGGTLDDLKAVRFGLFNRPMRYFDMGDEGKMHYQAEVLVKNFIPLKYITNISNFGIPIPAQPQKIQAKIPYTAQDPYTTLTEDERIRFSESYNKKAIEIIWGTRRGSSEDAEALYLKSAKLGNTEGMYKVALYNEGGITSNRKDYETAIYWLEEIVRLSKDKKVVWYHETLKDLIKIFTELGNTSEVLKYTRLLDIEEANKRFELERNARKSESDFHLLAVSILNGTNGFSRDEEKAYQLIEDGVKKGYRSLFGLYSDFLRKRGDEKYFYYLIEDIKDTEKALSEEYSHIKFAHNDRTASWMYRTHQDYWLTKRYYLVAEAYFKGFGVDKDLNKAEEYINKAEMCDERDKEVQSLKRKILNTKQHSKVIPIFLCILIAVFACCLILILYI